MRGLKYAILARGTIGRYRQQQARSKLVFEVAVLFVRPVAFRLQPKTVGLETHEHT